MAVLCMSCLGERYMMKRMYCYFWSRQNFCERRRWGLIRPNKCIHVLLKNGHLQPSSGTLGNLWDGFHLSHKDGWLPVCKYHPGLLWNLSCRDCLISLMYKFRESRSVEPRYGEHFYGATNTSGHTKPWNLGCLWRQYTPHFVFPYADASPM